MSASISRDIEILLLAERDETSVAPNVPVLILTEIDAIPTVIQTSKQGIYCRL